MSARIRPLLVQVLVAVAALVGLAAPAYATGQVQIDAPATNTTTGSPFWITGWAINPAVPTGPGVDMVVVWACPTACDGSNGIYWGQATYGASRADVGAAFGDSRFTPSGYSFLVSGQAPGSYQVVVYGRSAGTTDHWTGNSIMLTLTASPWVIIDGLANLASVAQPLALSGWAVDFASGSGPGMDAVTLWAYPNPGSGAPAVWLGNATYGFARPELSAWLQRTDSQFTPSGWYAAIPTLAPGEYLLLVYAHSPTTQSWVTVTTRTIYVDAPTVNLVIDRAGTGTGGITASAGGLSCAGGSGTQGIPCQTSYLQTSGTSVTLTATPDAGSTFAGWTGACSGTSPCTLTMSEPQYVGATFAGAQPAAYETRYYHLDPLGSVRAITDQARNVVAAHEYGPFGEDIAPLGGDPRRYTGNELDAETGLQYHGARYYRTLAGRFGAVDPGQAGVNPFSPQSWNGYTYVGNRPLVLVDPEGAQGACLECSRGNPFNLYSDYYDSAFLSIFFDRMDQRAGGPGPRGNGSPGAPVPPSPIPLPPPQRPSDGTDETSSDPNDKPCEPGISPSGIIVGYGGNIDVGAATAGATATAGVGVGSFYDNREGVSFGALAFGGSATYAGPSVKGAPAQRGQPFSLGPFAGMGPSLTITNARSVRPLGGLFTTFSLNVGVGPTKGSLQLSVGNGIWEFSASGGPVAPGWGLSFSKVTTNTVTTTTGCKG